MLLALAVGTINARAGARVALTIALTTLVLLLVLGSYLAREGTRTFSLARAGGVNLIASRGEPRVWLCAHLDTKSQTIPILLRMASIVATTAAWLVLLALLAALASFTFSSESVRLLGWAVAMTSVVAFGSALPLAICIVGNGSCGALDNACGVAAVLLAVRGLQPATPVGVYLTTAEELALAGARELAHDEPPRVVLNCDTIDDSGRLRAMFSGAAPAPLITRLEAVAKNAGLEIETGRMLPGVWTDSVAFTEAGWQALTLSKGSMATLAKIHTAGDVAGGLSGGGVTEAAALLTAVVEESATWR